MGDKELMWALKNGDLDEVKTLLKKVGCELEGRERFWSELDEVMESIPTGERVVIGADFNGHVGEGNRGDEEVMGKFGVKERNLEGQMVVNFAKRMDMDVVNTYFQKREEHRVTYKSGDLEKAYDRVSREEQWYCMRKSGVAENYVRVVQDMYERSRTVVRCAVGQTEEFNVEVGLHQGSALSPFLFAIVMDQLSEEVRQESPCTMMFANDIVICSESREQVEENLERWIFALERRGMKDEDVNRTLESGRKPLHYAADCGQAEMVEFLLSKGADVNAPDKHGITPLLSATYEGHYSCVQILLEKGADKERKGPDGLSAFEAAESEAIKALLK
ncbi:hypothetical protein QTP86_013971 [Hemibagrus guttatus]|nr:hypothetical protein QTP86_013971 [Hemibagrus guttatus]